MANNEQKKRIHQYLLSVGIKPHNAGFVYLVDAIEMMIEEKSPKLNICAEVYQKIADKYIDTTWQQVERCIRYVISRSNDKAVKEMKNREFIALAILEVDQWNKK